MAKTPLPQILPPEIEQEVLALWSSLQPSARTVWLKVFDTLLPPDAGLLQVLDQLEATPPPGSAGSDNPAPAVGESAIARLAMIDPPTRRPKDWRRTVGMFANDPIMEGIIAASNRIREAERTPE
ncbi:MAG: hypothetical protein M3Z04_04950 [Chloroflexota bacterium]|nr:hypothetical protein [Chloroflexota bacterium]